MSSGMEIEIAPVIGNYNFVSWRAVQTIIEASVEPVDAITLKSAAENIFDHK